jgi:glycosyltransferase involved in cell wall biosynthesis
MNIKPLVSAVIPTYNRSHYVAQAVVSVLKQTYGTVEIIVVDDGSTDDTADVLSPYSGNIHYIYQSNEGVAIARNKGIRAARGELVAFLDADDLWLPRKLEFQMQYLERSKTAGLIHTNALYLDAATGLRHERRATVDPYEGECYARLFLGNRITTSSVLLRRECLEKVGAFDENIRKASTEDYDLWIRIARYYEFAYVKEPLVLYRLHPNNAVKDLRTLMQNERYVLEKAIKDDPALFIRVGKKKVYGRLFRIYLDLGYDSFNISDLSAANRYFGRALQVRFDPYTFLLWLASFFPTKFVKRARLWKQRFAASI